MPAQKRGDLMRGSSSVSGQGVRARLPRKEDDRYLRGEGQFVGDFRLPRMHDVAFLRSPIAHARIRSIQIPPALRHHVFIALDLVGVRAIRADTALPGFKSSLQPVLATEKVRHVGEPIALCVAPTTAEAEDMAAGLEVYFDTLPPVHDMMAARQDGSSLVHEPWGDKMFLANENDADFACVKVRGAASA